MSDILGYDRLGKAVRPGDRLVSADGLESAHWMPPQPWTAARQHDCGNSGCVTMEDKFPTGDEFSLNLVHLRKIDDDRHQPADQSFGDLMEGLKGDVKSPDGKEAPSQVVRIVRINIGLE